MFSRALLSIVAGAGLVAMLTGCSALTRPDEITIQAEPIGAAKAEPAPAAPGAQAPAMGAQGAAPGG